MELTLLFVYNADSGLVNGALDWAHKIFSPSTYQCSLCALTYGNLGMRPEWRNFIDTLPVGVRFFHRDEFRRRYDPERLRLPAVFLQIDDRLEEWITSEELDRLNILDELKLLVRRKLDSDLEAHGWQYLRVDFPAA